jgi:hypothetical protein
MQQLNKPFFGKNQQNQGFTEHRIDAVSRGNGLVAAKQFFRGEIYDYHRLHPAFMRAVRQHQKAA